MQTSTRLDARDQAASSSSDHRDAVASDWTSVRHIRHPIAFVLFIILGSSLLSAASGKPKYVTSVWQLEDGLPQQTVRTITQTRDGYLWLGTFNGVVRFDGVRFTTFNSVNTPDLRSDDTASLMEDRSGRLWIGTQLGLVRYENGRFVPCPEADQMKTFEVLQMVEQPDGTVVVATDHGLFVVNANTATQVPIPNDGTPTGQNVLAMDSEGKELWFACQTGLYRLVDGRLERELDVGNRITSLFIDRENTFWLGLQEHMLATWRRGDPAVQPADWAGGHIAQITQSADGSYWIASDHGVHSRNGNETTTITADDGLRSDRTIVVFEDRERNIWAGTDGGGLHRLRVKPLETFTTENGLTENDAATLMEDSAGRVWLGTFGGGLNLHENDKWNGFVPDGFPSRERIIVSLCRTKAGTIWIGTYGSGLYRSTDNGFVRESRVISTIIRALFEDSKGALWIGTHNAGVYRLDDDDLTNYDAEDGLSLNQVTSIAEDQSGAIWVGTKLGLNRITNGKVESFFREDGVGANTIHALLTDESGTLWIGTVGGGLARYRDGHFATLNSQRGLPNDVVSQMIDDGLGNLWIGTRMGIARIEKEALHSAMDGKRPSVQAASFTKADGLIELSSVGGFQPTGMKSADGNLWFCGPGGVVRIDPKTIEGNQIPPDVHIEEIVADGVRMHTNLPRTNRTAGASASVSETSALPPITIAAGTQRIEVRYTGLSFSAPNRVQFQMILEGYDTEWQQVGTRRIAYYTKVPPGSYRFHVKAANSDGVWNEDGATLPIVVEPQYWETLWFRPAVFLLLAGLAGAGWRYRTRQNKRLEALRLRIADDLHDEVGSNLSNIALLSGLAMQSSGNGQNSCSELGEIRQVALETASSVRDIVWFVNPQFDTVGEMIRHMQGVANRTLRNIPFRFDADCQSPGDRLSLISRSNLFFAYKEALHNIVKHSNASQVDVRIQQRNRTLNLSISDNGIGFDPNAETPGIGLKSIRRRVAELNGSLSVESRAGQGASINVQLPLT